MEKLEQLYEGKAKKIYATSDPNLYWVEYKDDATAFNGEKKAQIAQKGSLNNQITTLFFNLLKENGVDNHFVEQLSATEQIVKKVTIIPIEVVVRNIAAGSLAKRLGMEEGTELTRTVVEYYYKDDALGDPIINDDHIALLELASVEQLATIKSIALKVNDILKAYMLERKTILVDFKLEFGVTPAGEVILADEISPDTCRFWDAETKQKLDKDRFRRDLGGVEEAYQEILNRVGGNKHV
ncbi:phosphoribosylaminoimidazolesuccinocarboxamide synthase [Caldalkalibacillus mannanilyticus]|uniref:phosphoribosylaminoimidazolesuccinocarboxamide synthase n=1 Tax=Caldalkalibacillus mannanilyticus TaxID=1418 RepID=UPI000468EA43|nr:phosphoribosylaminoimidazolesuccinocarboxamide synthase [Caldalkalibacillus mannanilyticus]